MRRRVVLGVHLWHTATAALLIDGELVGNISQEKFDNVKNSSAFPFEPVDFLLKEFNVKPSEIDAVAISSRFVYPVSLKSIKSSGRRKEGIITKLWKNADYYLGHSRIFRNIVMNMRFMYSELTTPRYKRRIYSIFSKKWGISQSKIHFVRHHDAHAAAAYFSLCKNKKEAGLVLTIDGSGDKSAATISIAKGGKVKRILSTRWDSSLGYVYSHTTSFLGMKPLEHEYKVMGLAPYAKSYYLDTYNKLFKGKISFSRKTLKFYSPSPLNRFNVFLEKNALYERFDNVAAGLQKLTEEVTVDWIKAAVNKFKLRTIYLGGGVFMNVKLNKRIMEMPEVERAYFMPSCGDESTAAGAAYRVYCRTFEGNEIKPLEHVYLGIGYTNEDVKNYIQQHKIDAKYKVKFFPDIEKEIAALLSKGQVVARVKGRCEWGARALGNRTILADPSKMESFYTVNDQVKMRDFWMPFAPSILAEDADKYIKNPKKYEAPYMILAFDSTEEGQDRLRAAMHQADKTLRPQIVRKEVNPSYHKLISYFKKLTGIGAVLNTSLNLHGYPLVATLEQAFFTFENSGLQHMAIENYLIWK